MDAQVYKTLATIAACEDASKKEALMEQTNDRLGAYFTHPAHEHDLAELAFDLFNNAWSDTMNENVVQRLIEVKNVGLGDPDYVNEDLRGLRAYWQGKGGQILSDVLRYERATMPKEEMVAALDFHVDEVELDFWGNLTKLQTQIEEKLEILPTQKLVELIQKVIVSGAYYGTFAASTLTDDQVDTVIEQVAIHTGGQVSIVGTRRAVRQLAGIGLDFGPNVQEQVFNTGQIGVYKGYPVVQVENFEDFQGYFVLPDDELWLVGRNSGRLTYYGPNAKVQQLPLPSFYRRWETARDAGMLLYGADKGRIGRIVLT